MLLVLAGKKKHRWVTESGTRLRWQGGGTYPGWHIDGREGVQSLWWHPEKGLEEPPLTGWQFGLSKYEPSVLLLQAGIFYIVWFCKHVHFLADGG